MNPNKTLTPLRTGAAYIRVSTHMQEELSPDAQKRILLDYAKAHNIVITQDYIFQDGGISGKKADKRPAFMRMISLAKEKPAPFSVILVWKFSRFARNQEESIVYKSLLRKQCHVEVVSVSEPIIDGPFGSLIERIIEWMDEYYSIRLSGEVFRGMSEKAMRGGYLARPPLGYRIERRGEPPVIVPGEAATVRIIFHKYVEESMGIFDIARYLNALGLKTREQKPFERRGVEYILQNPIYCGMVRWNVKASETQQIKAKEEWILTDGHHEPIIPKELFDRAQERRKQTYRPSGTRPSSTYRHWLGGIVKCPVCGRTMIAKHMKDKRYGRSYCYFTCYGYSKGKCTAKRTVSSKKLEPIVLAAIREAMTSRNLSFELRSQADAGETNELQPLREQLGRIPDKEARIKEAYRNGIDTLEEYRQNKELINKERKLLQARIDACTPVKDDTEDLAVAVSRRIHGVYDILTSENFTDTQKNTALKSIVSKIVCRKDESIVDVYYYYSG